jgi:phage-related minor tail protein
MEDSIVSFAKTGKFEFKDLINTILEELLRSQIQRLIASTFGSFGGGGGGGGSNPFAGFFANGGLIPSGKFGVVGENGPELVSGPANITPLNGLGGGGSQVIYNINAVDAPSFKSMIARDPGFIHAVAQQGARKVPVRR